MDRHAAAIMAILIIIPIAAPRVGAAGPISIVRVSACDAAGLAEAMAMFLNGRPQGARFLRLSIIDFCLSALPLTRAKPVDLNQ
jgi:hypothetical protein